MNGCVPTVAPNAGWVPVARPYGGRSGPSTWLVISPGVSARYQWAMPNTFWRSPLDQFLTGFTANSSS